MTRSAHSTTQARDHLYRWIRAADAVPGFVVKLPYGGGLMLEIVDVARDADGNVTLTGWASSKDDVVGRPASGLHRPNSPLWLINDLREHIAY